MARGKLLVLFVGDDILPDSRAGRRSPRRPRRGAGRRGRGAQARRVAGGHAAQQPHARVDGPGAQQFSYSHFADGDDYDYRHLYTANVSLKRSFLHTPARASTPSFPYAAFEDAELAYRLTPRGLRIRYAAAPIGYHYHYHTVWSFARRQYQVRGWRTSSRASTRRWRMTCASRRRACWRVAAHLPTAPCSPGRPWAAWVEEHALRLANHHEWTSHPLVDQLYVQVLDYFWQSGLIDGVFGGGAVARRVRDAYAAAHLASQLADTIDRALAEGLRYPGPTRARCKRPCARRDRARCAASSSGAPRRRLRGGRTRLAHRLDFSSTIVVTAPRCCEPSPPRAAGGAASRPPR